MTAEDYAKTVGKNLKSVMAAKDVTQAQLAHDLKIPKATVSSWVTGKRLPRAAALDAVCRYLQCTKYDILDGPQEPPQPVQKPAGEPVDEQLGLVLDALDQAGYGRLRALMTAAWEASDSSIEFVTGLLKRNQKK